MSRLPLPGGLLPQQIDLPSPEATDAFARSMADVVRGGDTLLLEGPIGAGKSRFARALVTELLRREGAPPEDVPSPTFTLVQSYRAGPLDIWHVDLYRLSGAADVMELGLDEALGTALCLIEWPDRLGTLVPAQALTLRFTPEGAGDRRRLTLEGPATWASRLDGAGNA